MAYSFFLLFIARRDLQLLMYAKQQYVTWKANVKYKLRKDHAVPVSEHENTDLRV